MPRAEPLIRQWNLLRLLQDYHYGLAADELADRLDCSVRQVKRDLNVLTEVGFPVDFDEREFGKRFWTLEPSAVDPSNVLLSVTEMISLFLSRQLLAPLAGTQFGDGLGSALEKIKTILPQKALTHFRGLDERLFVKSMPGHDYSAQDKEIRIINQAIKDSRVLNVRYHSAHSGRDYQWRVHPYGIVLFGMSLYCVGYVPERGEVRTLKVERLRGVSVTGQAFERPYDFSLHDYLHGSFGIFTPGRRRTVRVRFTDWAATNVREITWHPSQKILEDDARRLVAQFKLSDTTEFKRWVLGFGRHATVLAPTELAQEIADELATASDGYDQS
jgi:predicted DNA-binding transcriptional regulator YafY